ncbi:MAG: site-specific integrase, partial [Fusobacteriaceae bacterium]
MKIILDGLNIEEELKEYVLDLEEMGKSYNTIKNYKIWIESFINYVKISNIANVDKTIEITRVKLIANRYQKHLQKLKQKNTTINLKIIALNSFFRYLHITEEDKRGRAIPVKIPTLEVHHKHSIEDNRLMELGDFFKLLEVAKEKGDLRAV